MNLKLPFFFIFFTLPPFLSPQIAATSYDVVEATATTPLIQETCRKVALNDPNLSYGFCRAALQSAPNSLCADSPRKLGLISIKLVRGNITSTRCYIEHLLGDKKIDPYFRSCLDDCLELYSDALPTVNQAIKDYQAKRYSYQVFNNCDGQINLILPSCRLKHLTLITQYI